MLTVSERRACRVLGQVRRTQRYTSRVANDEAALTANIVSLASEYGRYGYRRITALLTADELNRLASGADLASGGAEGARQTPEARSAVAQRTSSCIRLRPAYGNHVWAYDFVFDRTRDGRPLKLLTVVDEFTRQCLAIDVARKQSSRDVLRILAGLMLRHGIPKHIRSDNGPEFAAKAVREVALEVGRSRRCSSSREVRGRTATSKASTANSGTNSSTGRFSRRWRRQRC